MKRYVGPAVLVVSSVILALLFAEGALRALNMYPPPDWPPQTPRPDLYTEDPLVGYRMHANLDTSYRYPPDRPDPIPLVANSDGFRSAREFGSADERPTVLVVGDSFVFGEGVRAEERFGDVLETLEPEWRVESVGMPGWGVDLMVRALETLAPKIRPEVVVLSVYTDDFRRLLPYYFGAGFAYPQFRLNEDSLVTVARPGPGFWERRRITQAWLRGRWGETRNQYELNEALLDRFLELAHQYDFEPMTIFIPGRGDNEEDQERRGFLRDWSDGHGVPYVDLTQPIHSAGVDDVYITGNFHWNPEGHRIAAEQIRPVLKGLLGAATAP